jgi:hypothetical protein
MKNEINFIRAVKNHGIAANRFFLFCLPQIISWQEKDQAGEQKGL